MRAMIGALRTDAVSSLEEVRSLQALVTQAYAAWEANVHERRAALLEDADRGLRRAASTIAAHESEARDAARVVAAGKAAVLAPGALGASWADEAWGRPNELRGLGTGVRIGSSALGDRRTRGSDPSVAWSPWLEGVGERG